MAAKRGRPKGTLVYGPEFRDEVVEWIASGRTLRDYCRQEGKPNFVTVYRWMDDDKGFEQRFARAREIGHDAMAQECITIPDTEDDVQRAKLKVWTRLQLLARWDPKRYSERMAVDSTAKVEHSGEVRTGPPVPDPEEFRRYVKTLANELSDD